MSEPYRHRTVMIRETLDALRPRSGGLYADATVGGGGHAEAILETSAPGGRLLGVDRDPRALAAARERLARFVSAGRATLVHGRFSQLPALVSEMGAERVDGLVADLGVSSPQLDDASRGFSFSAAAPLDMRMDPTEGETAAELLARLDEEELAAMVRDLGEERRARAVARSIRRAVERGELSTTADLRRAVVRALGPRRGRIDPATRTFQAVRIAVNRELEELRALVAELPDLLADDAVAVIISFHSLEDRIVKRAFRGDARLSPLTKKPLVAADEETADNPRARSAKLRAARRAPRATEVAS